MAPDWSADWLHREAQFILNGWAEPRAPGYEQLAKEAQAALRARLALVEQANRYDAPSGDLKISDERAAAFDTNVAQYTDVFGNGRDAYAMRRGTLSDPTKMHALAAFFFWTAWASVARRPGDSVSYTSNWPHEPLVGNVPTGETVVWTGVSIILLLAGIGGMATWYAIRKRENGPLAVPPTTDPLLNAAATPSQRAIVKYLWVAGALLLVQILLGIITAHYGVEGSGFYGIPLDRVLPYSLSRTWHLQLGIFWNATTWLATGLYVGPAVGAEPKYQRLGANMLFGALLIVVVGSLTGEWLSVMGRLPLGDQLCQWHNMAHTRRATPGILRIYWVA